MINFTNDEIKRFAEGNKKMQRIIFNNYFHILKFKYNEDIAVDALSSVFINFKLSGDTSNNLGGVLTSFINKAAKNAYIDSNKTKYKQSAIIAKDLQSEYDYDILQNIPNKEEINIDERLYIAINRLKKNYRDVINLKLEGLSQQQIADRLNISLSTVKTRQIRAYKMLKEMLKDKNII